MAKNVNASCLDGSLLGMELAATEASKANAVVGAAIDEIMAILTDR
jgi:hypothetical protein